MPNFDKDLHESPEKQDEMDWDQVPDWTYTLTKTGICAEGVIFDLQRESDSSTNCSNIIDELGLNSLDVCLEQTVRNCDPLAVKMGTPTFSLLYEKLCDAVILADRATKESRGMTERDGSTKSEKHCQSTI